MFRNRLRRIILIFKKKPDEILMWRGVFDVCKFNVGKGSWDVEVAQPPSYAESSLLQ